MTPDELRAAHQQHLAAIAENRRRAAPHGARPAPEPTPGLVREPPEAANARHREMVEDNRLATLDRGNHPGDPVPSLDPRDLREVALADNEGQQAAVAMNRERYQNLPPHQRHITGLLGSTVRVAHHRAKTPAEIAHERHAAELAVTREQYRTETLPKMLDEARKRALAEPGNAAARVRLTELQQRAESAGSW